MRPRRRRALLCGPSTSPLGGMETPLLGERFVLYAQGHHGFPYPDVEYGGSLYESWCQRCGIHGAQRSSVVVPGSTLKAPKSAFLQLNWMFDVFLVRRDVATVLSSSGLSGFEFSTVSGTKAKTIDSHRQLVVTAILPCVDTSRLKTVTCRASNEEAGSKLPGKTLADLRQLPYCGRTKHHPPSTVTLRGNAVGTAPDVCLSAEWFGSGGSAFRLTIVSRRFREFVRLRAWRGLEFRQAVMADQVLHAT